MKYPCNGSDSDSAATKSALALPDRYFVRCDFRIYFTPLRQVSISAPVKRSELSLKPMSKFWSNIVVTYRRIFSRHEIDDAGVLC
jgi:hypothetical protein